MKVAPLVIRYSRSADLWSFGIVLLELAAGRVPHAQASFTALVMSTVHDPAPRLEHYAKRKYSQARLLPLHGCVSFGVLLWRRMHRRCWLSRW